MTNEVKNVPELRFPEFSEEWEDNLVGNIFEFKNGLNKGKEYFGYGIPIVNFKDVFHNRGIKSEYLNGKVDVSEKELQNYSVRKGDVFFTRTSEIIEEIGYPTVMMDEIPKAVFSGFVLRARPKKNSKLVDDKFKRYVFFTYSFRKEMITKSSITTRALTSGTAINKMKVIYPTSLEEQNKIGDFFRKLDRQIELEEQKLAKLEEQKKGYMQKLFSQELRFKDQDGNHYPKWEKKFIKDIFIFENNRRKPITSSLREKGLYPYYGATGIIDYVKDYLFNNEERLLIGEDGAKWGQFEKSSFIANGQYWVNNHAHVVKSNNHNLYFMNYYLNFKELRTFVAGNAPAKLTHANLCNINLEIPCLNEQGKISALLKSIDNKMNNQINKIVLLKRRKQGLLQKMFV